MLDPVNYWAATSGLLPKSEQKSSMPFSNFSSNVAKNYGGGFGGHGSQYGFTPTAGFEPVQSATKSMVQDFLGQQAYEADLASNALNALTNIKIAGMAPEPQAAAGGGGAPQQKKPSTSDRLWGLGTTVAGAAVTAGVGALI